MSWQEDRRLNKAAQAEQARQNALAAAQIEQMRLAATAQAEREHAALQADLDRQRRDEATARRAADRTARAARRDEVRARRAARWTALSRWAAAHVVDLLIYPLAVVSAVMAIPAMAEFGYHVYGTAAGLALPVITELGMWAFAFAIHIVRHRSARDGQDRPVWALQTGVWSFATVAAGLNFVHGLTAAPSGLAGELLTNAVTVPPFAAGLVMAVASVAGVLAHQLVTAAPREGRADRDAGRIERQAAVKVARVQKAAVRSAVAEIDDTGSARLVYRPGHYRLTRSRLAPWRPVKLTPAAVPGLPVTSIQDAIEHERDDMDRELARLLDTVDPYPGTRTNPDTGGGVGTLDRDGDQHESTPIEPDRKTRRTRKPRTGSTRAARKAARSIEDLRAELHRLIEADRAAGRTGDRASINPGSAESIRKALQCSPARARELRDTYQHRQH